MSKRKPHTVWVDRVPRRDLDSTLAFCGAVLDNLTNTELSLITGLPLSVVSDSLRAFRRLDHRCEWRYTRL